ATGSAPVATRSAPRRRRSPPSCAPSPTSSTPEVITTVETTSRRAAKDAVLAGAVEVARAALEAETEAGQVGEHLGFTLQGERLGSHAFACTMPGYVGWYWSVTVARAPRSRTATVCETGLLPGEGALLAKAWLPWAERLAPGDLGPTHRLPSAPAHPRPVSGACPTPDPPASRTTRTTRGSSRASSRPVTRSTTASRSTSSVSTASAS